MNAQALLEAVRIAATHAIAAHVSSHGDGVVPIASLLPTHVELGVTA